jgi:hypothetical protein
MRFSSLDFAIVSVAYSSADGVGIGFGRIGGTHDFAHFGDDVVMTGGQFDDFHFFSDKLPADAIGEIRNDVLEAFDDFGVMGKNGGFINRHGFLLED